MTQVACFFVIASHNTNFQLTTLAKMIGLSLGHLSLNSAIYDKRWPSDKPIILQELLTEILYCGLL